MATSTDFDIKDNFTRKFALIIANSYYDMCEHLPNSIDDAKQMNLILTQIGFEIYKDKEQINLHFEDFKNILEDFINLIQENDLIAFYYSSHGRQWKNKNYLIPIDNSIKDIPGNPTSRIEYLGEDLENYTIHLQDYLHRIHQKKPFVMISFFDSSRYYYFRNEQWKQYDEEIYQQGFTLIKPEINSIIVSSCLPNEIITEKSLFTNILCKYLLIPNKDIRILLSEITNEIIQKSNPTQIPYVISNLTQEFICLFQQTTIPGI